MNLQTTKPRARIVDMAGTPVWRVVFPGDRFPFHGFTLGAALRTAHASRLYSQTWRKV